MPTPKFRGFTKKVEMDRLALQRLLNAVAERAYKTGHKHGSLGLPVDVKSVLVSKRSVDKIP